MGMWIVHSGYTWKIYITRVELEISYKRKQPHCPKSYSQKTTTGFSEVNRTLCYNKYKRGRDFCKRILVSTERWIQRMRDREVCCQVSPVLQFFEAVCNKDHFVCERTLGSDHSFVFQKHMSGYEVIYSM